MRKNNAIAILAVFILGSFVFEGCKKREDLRFDSSTNNSEGLSVFDDVYKVVTEGAEGQSGLNKVEVSTWNLQSSASCATVTLTPLGSEFPKTLTIDFGDGCTGSDGRYRSGQIVCVFSGLYRAENTEIMVDLVDYELDNYQISRHQMLITNKGVNGAGQPYFTVVVHNASITSDDGTATWSSTRTRTWVEGSETTWFTIDTTQSSGIMEINGLLDDVYQISGTAEGTTRGGVPYTVDITAPLEVQFGCRFVKAGTLTVNPQNLDVRTIDFGNGDCDEGASVEVDGNKYSFTMW
ncbi:MAG: hypothetical protein ACI85F_001323 [Bacteroidia bacterium]|jgi:hypothetical protein